MKINEFFHNVGHFFQILDQSNHLSITNLALYVILIKIALSPVLSITDAGTLFIVLLNYTSKKVLKRFPEPKEGIEPIDGVTTKLKELSDKVGALSLATGLTGFKK